MGLEKVDSIDPQEAFRALSRALRGRWLAIQILWLPVTILMLILAFGFHAFIGASSYPVWIDTVLNGLSLGFFISLGLVPFGALLLFVSRQHIQKAAVNALVAHCPDVIPLERGEYLGVTKVVELTDSQLTLVRSKVPDIQRITTNIAFFAAAVGFIALAPPQPGKLVGYAVAMLILCGMMALVLGFVNFRTVIEITVVQGQQSVREFATIGKWHWPRYGETVSNRLSEECIQELGFSICPGLGLVNIPRLEIAIDRLEQSSSF